MTDLALEQGGEASRRRPRRSHILVFLAPAVVIYTAVMILPLIETLRQSFFNVVDGEHVFVDVSSYAQSGRAVVIGHNGPLRIEHVEPDTIGVRPFGPRTALGERRPGAVPLD